GGLLTTIKKPNSLPPTTYHATFDANGNITGYTDTNGTIVARYEYDPFGNVSAQTGTMADDFVYRFSTKYLDVETGLYYYGYRYYNPEMGRWINRDPLGDWSFLRYAMLGRGKKDRQFLIYASRKPLYIFVDNRSLNSIDLYGLTTLAEACCMILATGSPGSLVMVDGIRISAQSVANRHYPNDYGNLNAMQHCVGACGLSRLYGADTAIKLTECHETHGNSSGGGNNKNDTAADRWNNKVGSRYGQVNTSRSCEEMCQDAIDNGSDLITDPANDPRI
ncbi:MAG: hypothetical protein EOM12_15375, partial [Verrucomicrobiae bacterium]|nr:hypothetical protein [Verrucomicrobiae bacterium]